MTNQFQITRGVVSHRESILLGTTSNYRHEVIGKGGSVRTQAETKELCRINNKQFDISGSGISINDGDEIVIVANNKGESLAIKNLTINKESVYKSNKFLEFSLKITAICFMILFGYLFLLSSYYYLFKGSFKFFNISLLFMVIFGGLTYGSYRVKKSIEKEINKFIQARKKLKEYLTRENL